MQNLLKADLEVLHPTTLDIINKIIYSHLYRNNFFQLKDSKAPRVIQITKILLKTKQKDLK
jgi:hypothetical protein